MWLPREHSLPPWLLHQQSKRKQQEINTWFWQSWQWSRKIVFNKGIFLFFFSFSFFFEVVPLFTDLFLYSYFYILLLARDSHKIIIKYIKQIRQKRHKFKHVQQQPQFLYMIVMYILVSLSYDTWYAHYNVSIFWEFCQNAFIWIRWLSSVCVCSLVQEFLLMLWHAWRCYDIQWK